MKMWPFLWNGYTFCDLQRSGRFYQVTWLSQHHLANKIFPRLFFTKKNCPPSKNDTTKRGTLITARKGSQKTMAVQPVLERKRHVHIYIYIYIYIHRTYSWWFRHDRFRNAANIYSLDLPQDTSGTFCRFSYVWDPQAAKKDVKHVILVVV